MIVFQHGGHHRSRHANITEVNDFGRSQAEGARGIGYKSQHDAFLDAGLGQANHFRKRGGGSDIGRNRFFSGNYLRWCLGKFSLTRQ